MNDDIPYVPRRDRVLGDFKFADDPEAIWVDYRNLDQSLIRYTQAIVAIWISYILIVDTANGDHLPAALCAGTAWLCWALFRRKGADTQ